MKTLILNLFILLVQSKRLTKYSIPALREYSSKKTGNTVCENNRFFPYRRKAFWARPATPIKFTLVRDPVQRFVSLYEHFCDRLKACKGRDIHHFAKWINNVRHHRGAKWRKYRKANLDYRLIAYHMVPQTNFCQLGSRKKSFYIIRYSDNKTAMYGAFMRLFRRAHIPLGVARRALGHLRHSSTRHASQNEKRATQLKAEIAKTPHTVALIRSIYKEDYQNLKFP
ncbi:unnamed protein product, partial [Mesorhabditis belari]|uniref:Sulfotransferase family protein n=1 Tax=Mesorhabditis belari TaxID=2138241 RepID=A0AAF3EDW0_9BILA